MGGEGVREVGEEIRKGLQTPVVHGLTNNPVSRWGLVPAPCRESFASPFSTVLARNPIFQPLLGATTTMLRITDS